MQLHFFGDADRPIQTEIKRLQPAERELITWSAVQCRSNSAECNQLGLREQSIVDKHLSCGSQAAGNAGVVSVDQGVDTGAVYAATVASDIRARQYIAYRSVTAEIRTEDFTGSSTRF